MPHQITNCHVQLFTADHVPASYPGPVLSVVRKIPFALQLGALALDAMGRPNRAAATRRLYRLQHQAHSGSQETLMRALLREYPQGTRFVVVPIDFALAGYGIPKHDLEAQHDELARLAADPEFGPAIIPFATTHPDRPGAAREVERMIDGYGFRGLKIYPRLGFAPDHPVLMNEIYPMLEERCLPVISHCMRMGITGRRVPEAEADRYSAPHAILPVLDAFPNLNVCLAHFGGPREWRAYAHGGVEPGNDQARRENWMVSIRDLIGSGDWPNLWTDISYTMFTDEDFLPFLSVFIKGPLPAARRLAKRVLFGSDYHLTRRERLSERVVAFRLRAALGEEAFQRIAEINPKTFLNERSGRGVSPEGLDPSQG